MSDTTATIVAAAVACFASGIAVGVIITRLLLDCTGLLGV